MKFLSRIEEHSLRERKVFFFSLAVAIFLLAVDQLTKLWVVKCFKIYESVEIIPGFFNLTSVRNKGAAWSILSGKVGFLLVFSILVAICIGIFFRKLCEKCPERFCSLLMILSGICGNCIDRLYYGEVVDFLHVHYYNAYHYPVFNVADMAICCGVGIFLLSGFFRKSIKPGDPSC